jgi:hypothetical protein
MMPQPANVLQSANLQPLAILLYASCAAVGATDRVVNPANVAAVAERR